MYDKNIFGLHFVIWLIEVRITVEPTQGSTVIYISRYLVMRRIADLKSKFGFYYTLGVVLSATSTRQSKYIDTFSGSRVESRQRHFPKVWSVTITSTRHHLVRRSLLTQQRVAVDPCYC